MIEEEFNSQEESAPFNMALATLEALRSILTLITKLYATDIQDEMKQKLKINLVKRFYIDATPLLEPTDVDKFKEILKLKPKTLEIISSGTGEKTNKVKVYYNEELEITLDTHLINLQVALQKKGYYMPPRKDMGSTVGRF